MRRPLAIIVTASAVLVLAGCGGKPDGCVELPRSDAADLMKSGTGGYPTAAARLDADGGQYIAATIRMVDGSDATAVWFITDGGSGARTSVGAETALFSNFPSSERVGITVGNDNFRDVQKCLED